MSGGLIWALLDDDVAAIAKLDCPVYGCDAKAGTPCLRSGLVGSPHGAMYAHRARVEAYRATARTPPAHRRPPATRQGIGIPERTSSRGPAPFPARHHW